MKTYIDILSENNISLYAALSFSDCRVTRPYLYERESGFAPKSVLLFCVPYAAEPPQNYSVYAAGRDYHLYMQALFSALLPAMQTQFVGYRFLGFADRSPIDERHAAAAAGLGVIGDNRLLITERYSSYVFIGEVLSDLPPERLSAVTAQEPRECLHCGACRAACPSGLLRGTSALCLSAVTQKKGTLTAEEAALLKKGGSVWGCDACSEACPYTVAARRNGTLRTPIAFFEDARILHLTPKLLAELPDDVFQTYAFSWRGREPLLRNMALLEEPPT